MKPGKASWWMFAALAVPVLYFAAQFLPYYHSGGTFFPSMWSVFWYPARNEQTINFIALFYHGFRVNELATALLITQIAAIFLIVFTLILKTSGVIAFLLGGWGIFGIISFLTTRSLAFSPVNVYGGIASIIMLLIFLSAIILSALYLIKLYQNYVKIVKLYELEKAEQLT